MSLAQRPRADEPAEASLVMLSLARLVRLAQERQGLPRPAGVAPQVVCLKADAADAGLAPLVCIHPAGGSVISYKELCAHLDGERAVYAIQSQPDEARSSLCHATLDALAADYVQQLEACGLAGRLSLCGYSLGGAVAFEMARLLTARGGIVESVIVIDTPVRLRPPAGDAKSEAETITPQQLLMFGKVLAAGRGDGLALTAAHFEGLGAARQVERLIERLREMKLLGDAGDDIYGAVYRLVRHNERLQREHVPTGCYEGRVILIRAAAEAPELRHEAGALCDDPTFGWGAHCAMPVACVRVPGSHFNLMYPPFISSLGGALQRCLEAHAGPDMAGLFAGQVRRRPDSVALRTAGRAFTYRQLQAQALTLAERLAAAGVGRGDLVALCGERSAGHLVAMLAVIWLGAAYLPLDPGQPRERTDFMLSDAQPRLLLVDAATDPAAWPAWPVLTYAAEPDASADDARCAGPSRQPAAAAPGDLACVMYTSGTTGAPKGVCVTREGVVQRVHRVDYVRLGPESCLLQHSNLCFDASTFEIWGSLLTGAACALMPHARPSLAEFEAVVREHGVTTLFMTSALFRELVERRPGALRGVREVLVGGEVLAPAAARLALAAHPGLRFIHVYGPTECTVFALSRRFDSSDAVGDALPLGAPLPQTLALVLGDDAKPVADGIEGELCLGGAGLARGYLKRDDLTHEAFVLHRDAHGAPTRLYRTGDRVLRAADGELYFKGRLDRQVKVRGFRVELGEVEAVAKGLPGVLDAAVKAVPAATGENVLVAYAVARPEALAPEARRDTALRSERVAHWEQVYSRLLYKSLGSVDQAGADPTLNSTGWKSSFDGRAFSDAVMEEQIAAGVERILALVPGDVLEIGCGTGMLLFRVAPRCRSYLATDFSAAVLDYVATRAAEAGLRNLRLHHAPAEALPEAPPGGFDTVILNSVTEHFPSLAYLDDLLHRLVPLMKPGGHIYVGDNRDATLLPLFHAAVQLHRCAGTASVASLALRAAQAQMEETQLAIAPGYFTQLGELGLHCVDLQCKRGRHHNEMTQFRYDVTLRVGAREAFPVPASARRWRDGVDSQDAIRSELRAPGPLLLRALPNARLPGAALLLDAVAMASSEQTAGGLRRALDAMARATTFEDPEDWWALASETGRVASVMPSRTADGRFDVWLRDGSSPAPDLPNGGPATRSPAPSFANDPLLSLRAAAFARDVKAALQSALPSHAVPHFVVVLPHLPLTRNGKVDAAALPLPSRLQGPAGGARPIAPRGAGDAMEQQIAAVWESVLGVGGIAPGDDFFALGGDSLRAVRVAAILSRLLDRDVSPALLFEHRDLASLARALAAGAPAATAPAAADRGRQRRAASRRAAMPARASAVAGAGDAAVAEQTS